MTEPADPARQRFAALSLMRLVAAALIAMGIVIAYGRIDAVPADVAMPLGLALIAAGLIDIIIVIPMLTRRWRSPEP